MSCQDHFQCDAEFVKLLSRRRDVDLTTAALEIARDAYPQIDFGLVNGWIRERGQELRSHVARAKTEIDALKQLSECLAGQHGLNGCNEAFQCADGSYLNRVLETRRGIPISLSMIYKGVADQVGIDLRGVATPLHFLLRYESIEGPLFIDAYHSGRIMQPKECCRWLKSLCGLPTAQIKSFMKSVDARTIIIRMLNNLKALYTQQKNWHAAWLVQHRLLALQPCSYEQQRDLAVISIQAHRPGHAIELLNFCLSNCPQDEQEALHNHLCDAKEQLARWN